MFAEIPALAPPAEPLQSTFAFNSVKSLLTLIAGSVVDRFFEKESKPLREPKMLRLWVWENRERRWGVVGGGVWVKLPESPGMVAPWIKRETFPNWGVVGNSMSTERP
jgi:hypothetical protein